MVAHIVVAQQWGDIANESLARRDVVADERVEGMNSLEGIVSVVLVQIFSLYVPTLGVPISTGIVHHHIDVVGLYLLCAQRQIESARQ